MKRLCLVLFLCAAPATNAQEAIEDLPLVLVDRDDVVVERSCRIRIPTDARIEDDENDGVLQIRGRGIVIRFEGGSVLRGADLAADPDRRRGTAIRVEHAVGVQLIGARVEGFRVGLHAEGTEGLVVRDFRARHLWTARLRSSPRAEVTSDWLRPHANDRDEWLEKYAAALWLKDCKAPRLERIHVRGSQNGIVLSRSNGGVIVDCDASFLSGWGLAMWRSSDHLVSRNAFDFCVRGYSHGVYNRGQDSAGILLFEQCNRNVFLENSATHGGDGVFGFGGTASLDGSEPTGCNDNVFRGNDFSYAAAHGFEMTFSLRNALLGNRFVGNAICGIWGGYSQLFHVHANHFERNGDRGYGLERGGINIEHGAGHLITENVFRRNACGVHLWQDDDAHLADKPWVRVNWRGSRENTLARNRFLSNEVAVHLRASKDNRIIGNGFEENAERILAEQESSYTTRDEILSSRNIETPQAIGATRPVGARRPLAGRHNIVMTEWGPWDHEGPLFRAVTSGGARRVYEFSKLGEALTFMPPAAPIRARLIEGEGAALDRLVIDSNTPGVHPYRLTVQAGNFRRELSGTLTHTDWNISIFPLTTDPREDLPGFREKAAGEGVLAFRRQSLDLVHGMGGPADLPEARGHAAASWSANRFGTIATTRLPLPPGTWKLRTRSDDGIRIQVDNAVVLEDWTWHAPKEADVTFSLTEARTVSIVVEHFELDGYATLEVSLERVP